MKFIMTIVAILVLALGCNESSSGGDMGLTEGQQPPIFTMAESFKDAPYQSHLLDFFAQVDPPLTGDDFAEIMELKLEILCSSDLVCGKMSLQYQQFYLEKDQQFTDELDGEQEIKDLFDIERPGQLIRVTAKLSRALIWKRNNSSLHFSLWIDTSGAQAGDSIQVFVTGISWLESWTETNIFSSAWPEFRVSNMRLAQSEILTF